MSPLSVTSAGTVRSCHPFESREFVGSTARRGRGPHHEVEPGATPLSALCSAQGVTPGSTVSVAMIWSDAIDDRCCHRARRRRGCPSVCPAATPPLTPPARGVFWHLSMALVHVDTGLDCLTLGRFLAIWRSFATYADGQSAHMSARTLAILPNVTAGRDFSTRRVERSHRDTEPHSTPTRGQGRSSTTIAAPSLDEASGLKLPSGTIPASQYIRTSGLGVYDLAHVHAAASDECIGHNSKSR